MRNHQFDVDLSRLYPYPAPRRDRRNKDRDFVDSAWFDMMQPNAKRSAIAQREVERVLELELLLARYDAAQRDRRRAQRAPVLTRVHVDGASHMVACDVSSRGLLCSGRPQACTMDVEFKIPGLAFPIDARAEVIDFIDRPVLPRVNLRFIDLDTPYRDHIDAYVNRRLAR